MKKSLFTKILTCALAGGMILSSSACSVSGSKVDNTVEDTTTLNIMILNRGYGIQWVKDLATEFEKKNEGVTVNVKDATDSTQMDTSIRSGSKKNDVDLYFHVYDNQTASLVDTYSGIDGGIYDLTELYNTTIPGESVTYGEKMSATVKGELELNGKYYSVPWATASLGIFYNETVLNAQLGEGKWSLPNTSDELLALGDSFVAANTSNKNKYFLFPGGLDQVARVMFLSWWAQYEGVVTYKLFWEGKYNDPEDGLEGNSIKIYSQEGRLKSLEALEPLLRASNGYANENATNITQSNFKQYQTRFFSKSGGYALYPCGDWLEQESATGGDSTIKMMKLPVVSSIIEKCPTIADDAELSALITAIDANDVSLTGTGYDVSQDDYDKVAEARSVVTSMASNHIGYIPAYANAKKLASNFLLFMASDEGIAIYKNAVKGGFLPFTYNYETLDNLTTLERSVVEATKGATYVFQSQKNQLFYKGGIYSYTMPDIYIEGALNVAKSSKYYMTAKDVFDWYTNYYNEQSRWNTALSKLS